MEIKNICCIGAGYVGGPTMAVIALKCSHINVTVVDANPEKIKAWNGPLENLPVYEPGLSEVIKEVRGRNLFFSIDIKDAIEKSEMIFMAVNTPTKTEGEGAGMAADLSNIEACAIDIAKYSKTNKIVVEKSTLPVRTAEKIKEILEKNSEGILFDILSNPEFLAEGTAIHDLFKSDRVLIGGEETKSGQKAIKALVNIYSNWIPKEKILTTNVWSSELAKLASNAMLAQRISSINGLSALCEKTGANIDELSKAIGMDHRIGPHFLKTSVGFGGSCFKKDILNLVYICNHFGLEEVAEYWHSVLRINYYQTNRFANKVISYFDNNIKNKKISFLGWSFKKNTNDSRESPSIYVADLLIKKGAELRIYDPLVNKSQIKSDLNYLWKSQSLDSKTKNLYFEKITFCVSVSDSLIGTDSSLILTEWDEFIDYNWNETLLKSRDEFKIFDGRNILRSKINDKSIISLG